MPRYLDTRGRSTLAVGICDRCRFKFPLGDLRRDRASPGLLVCDKDNDQPDPWLLPARKPDSVIVKLARPDQPLTFATVVVPPPDTSDPYAGYIVLTDASGTILTNANGDILIQGVSTSDDPYPGYTVLTDAFGNVLTNANGDILTI